MRRLILLLALLVPALFIRCSDDDSPMDNTVGNGDGGDMMTPDNPQRLPQAVIDQISYTSSFMADMDGDGDDDLLLGPANGPSADILLLNDGEGFFTLAANAFPTRYQGTEGQTVNMITADFNGDGRLDVLSSSIDGREPTFSESAQIHLYLNEGNNTFSDGSGGISDNFFAVGWVEWLRVGDFNKDGHPDFVTTAPGLGPDGLEAGHFVAGYIYLNDGQANFSRTTIQMDDNGAVGAYTSDLLIWDAGHRGDLDRYALDIFVGDVDNDGDDDLVASNGFAGGLWPTFLNVSDGSDVQFEIVFNGNGNEDPFDEIVFKNGALMDIDNDGFLDVIGSVSIAGLGGAPVEVFTFMNNGQGQFSEATGLISGTPPGLDHARQWLVADYNGDGRDDLFIADHGLDFFPFPGFRNTLLLGEGTGLANRSSNVGTAVGFTHGAAVGDIDGDGSIDLFMNNHLGLEDIDGATADFFIYLNDGTGRLTGTE